MAISSIVRIAKGLSESKRTVKLTEGTKRFVNRPALVAEPAAEIKPVTNLAPGLSEDEHRSLVTNLNSFKKSREIGEGQKLGIPYLAEKKKEGDWKTISRVMDRHSKEDWWSPEFKVGRSNYDEDLDSRAKKFGWDTSITVMTPDEYIDQATRVLGKMEGNPKLTRQEVERTRTDSFIEIRKKMIEHGNFDIPYLQMTKENPGQEGINRAMAAKSLGIDEIPVLVIKDKASAQATQ